MDDIITNVLKRAVENEYSVLGGLVAVLTIGAYYIVRGQNRQAEREIKDLTIVMDSMPEEHRPSVGRVLSTLKRQGFLDENIRYLTEKYHL